MDYEKLYKEALERATKLAFTGNISATAAGEIFNELKESKDEKIRKEIYRYFRDLQLSSDREFSPSISVDEILAWLEKQDIKLQEYIDEERNKKDFYCEGKEMSWNEIPLDVRKHDYPYYFKGDLDCYPFNVEKQGKQKPVEQDTEIHDLWEYIREWNDKFGRLPKDEDELASCIDYVMKRQKLAEWNEDDEEKLRDVIRLVEQGAPVRPIRDHYTDWLKSLKDRFQLQPKQEWNEEDEEMYKEVLTDIIYAKNDLKTKGCLGLSERAMKAFNWFSKRHKSLRPQSKWKPSEEQMIALKNAIIGKRGPLYELYFDLEKL